MKRAVIILALFAAVLSGCSSMQMYEEGVDRENPDEHFSYPMPIERGKTCEFSYSAQLTRRNRSLWFIKLLNLVYL